VRIVAGDVTVTSGAQSHIDVRRESGDDVHVEFQNGTLFVSQPDPDAAPLERFFRMFTDGRRHRATVSIVAPVAARVQVSTVSAPAVVSGFDGGTDVNTVSGEVTLARLRDEVDVKTVSGDIEAKEIAAGIKLKTVSGDIGVVDGSCRWVDAKTVSGDVLLDLDLDPQGTYDITTVSGNVSLRTIAEPDLAVDASSVSGHLVSDFGLDWEQRPGRRHTSETIGSGGARLWVKTVSGDLRVLSGRAAA
jgi:DUF4097 and DUF4098 domain-containing protein YvlB